MTTPRLYDDLSHLWPLLSPPEDYAAEADQLKRLLVERLPASVGDTRPSLLELGVGGGHVLRHLTGTFDCTAVDISKSMLTLSRKLNPTVTHHHGDMRTIRLDQQFDAALVHDAIDYMTTRDDAKRAIETVAAHLRPGGIAIVAPTYVRETYTDHDTACDVNVIDDRELAYISHVAEREPEGITMTLVIMSRDRGMMRIEEDRHTCGLFPASFWQDAMNGAGLDVFPHEDEATDRPHVLFVGKKRGTPCRR